MNRFWGAVTSRFKPESGKGITTGFIPDRSVAELDLNSTLQLARQTLMLSRRRRCATEHLDGDLIYESSVAFALESWYSHHGVSREDVAAVALSDLQAIYNNPKDVNDTLKKRILLTRYFSRTGELEDCYEYGDIEPFIFESEGAGKIGLRETFHDRLPFPQRVETVVSFNPETKGFKHQIRYFRALLASYGIARLLSAKGVRNPLIDAVQTDEKALAHEWLSLAKKMKELSIDPWQLLPDESMLYDDYKVAESAMLFNMYTASSQRLLGLEK
jgi:hypothetical protein